MRLCARPLGGEARAVDDQIDAERSPIRQTGRGIDVRDRRRAAEHSAQFASDIESYRSRIKGLLQEKQSLNSEKGWSAWRTFEEK